MVISINCESTKTVWKSSFVKNVKNGLWIINEEAKFRNIKLNAVSCLVKQFSKFVAQSYLTSVFER